MPASTPMPRRKAVYKDRIVSFVPIPEVADPLRAAAAKDALWDVKQIAVSDEDREREVQRLDIIRN